MEKLDAKARVLWQQKLQENAELTHTYNVKRQAVADRQQAHLEKLDRDLEEVQVRLQGLLRPESAASNERKTNRSS